MHKILGIISILLSIWAMLPYIISIHQGKIKPHAFSWIIWGVTTCIVGLAQWTNQGGAGSWSIIFSGLLTFYIAILAMIQKSDSSATKSDLIFFCVAIASIPIWALTKSPLYSVLLLSTIDVLGYGPTIRKSFENPYEESLSLFVILSVRNIFATIALEHYSLTTMFFPLITLAANLILIAIILIRRSQKDKIKKV